MVALSDFHYAIGIVLVLLLLVHLLGRSKETSTEETPTEGSNNILNWIVFVSLAIAFAAVQIWKRLFKRRASEIQKVAVEQVK